jgi:hypothetical protein
MDGSTDGRKNGGAVKPLSKFVNCCSLQDGKYQRERDDASAWGIELLQTKSTCSVDDVAPTSIRGF